MWVMLPMSMTRETAPVRGQRRTARRGDARGLTGAAGDWTQSAETWNGRIAMLAIVVVLILEVVSGQGVLSGRLQ